MVTSLDHPYHIRLWLIGFLAFCLLSHVLVYNMLSIILFRSAAYIDLACFRQLPFAWGMKIKCVPLATLCVRVCVCVCVCVCDVHQAVKTPSICYSVTDIYS